MKSLDGKVAVVTEAVGSVGLATARTRALVARATRVPLVVWLEGKKTNMLLPTVA